MRVNAGFTRSRRPHADGTTESKIGADGEASPAGVVMLAAVVFNATGMTSLLKGANGVADRLETTLLNLANPLKR
jgi:hypothetical protein